MGVLDDLFRRVRPATAASAGDAKYAGEIATSDVALSVLFDRPLNLNSARQTAKLRQHHVSLAGAQVEIDATTAAQGTPLGVAWWGPHRVTLFGLNQPMPGQAVEWCVSPSHYGAELKAAARAHQSHVLLYYAGTETDVLEQYVALELVAGSLRSEGAIVVLNESARTSLPVTSLSAEETMDTVELLHRMPLLYLPCGFVKYNLDDGRVFMRTYGGHIFGWPDVGTYTKGHGEGSRMFKIFSNMFRYLLDTGVVLRAGHTTEETGSDNFMKLRDPLRSEARLCDENPLLIADFIARDAINKLNNHEPIIFGH